MSEPLTDADLDRWEKFFTGREQPNECVAALTNATQLRLIAEVLRLRALTADLGERRES
jgi:hypothetical protein